MPPASGQIKEFRPDLFVVDGEVNFYGFVLPTRMFIVSLRSSQLLVYSPTPLDAETRLAVDRLGQVAFIVAPNKIHNSFVPQWRQAYPEAVLYASPGLPQRRPEVRWDGTLGELPAAQVPFAEEVPFLVTSGNTFFAEVLLYHRASGTCLVADVVEHMTEEWVRGVPAAQTRWGRAAVACVDCCYGGLVGRAGPSPEFQQYASSDPARVEATAVAVAAWDFDALLICHGELIERGGKEALLAALAELAAISRRRPKLVSSCWSWLGRLQ